MKTFLPVQKPGRWRPPGDPRRGIALVIVLAMLVLLSGLLVAFITSATTEQKASQANSDSVTTRQIADSTVNLVLGQLREATTPVEGTTWSSQPGAIRTYSGKIDSSKQALRLVGGSTGSYRYKYNEGADDYVFKLYSSDRMKVKSGEYATNELREEVKVISEWEEKQAIDYVDLNAPFLSKRLDLNSNGTIVEPHYPIIDPRAKYIDGKTDNATANAGAVDGFDAKITRDPKLRLLSETDGAGAAVPYVPMPVKWLYVLKDGSIGSASRATTGNPIVGRTAFWVDDESCKLNINTSSEGTFWDTPMATTEQEVGTVGGTAGSYTVSAKGLGLGAVQPVRGEYQRYSGHPFTTSLSPVLGWMWGIKPTTDVYPSIKEYQRFKEAIYQITPFTPFGKETTRGGTVNTDKAIPPKITDVPLLDIPIKHLYANVDELIFKAQRNSGGAEGESIPHEITPPLTALDPKRVPSEQSAMKPEDLEKLRYFLTATSRAPDINLYGRPRVTLWPVARDFDRRTNFDDLFAFSSTIYKHPSNDDRLDNRFYLTRYDATSDTNDFNDGTAGSKSQGQKMYDYLSQLMRGEVTPGAVTEIPGFGKTFKDKFKQDSDQILTEIFDYSRTVNLVDTGTALKSQNKFKPYTPRFYKDGYVETYGRQARSVDWSGQVVPLKVRGNDGTATAGLGRFITLSEAALIFHRPPLVGAKAPIMPQGLQAVLALEMSTTMGGFPALRETFYTQVIATTPMMVAIGSKGAVNANFCTTKMINICNLPAHELAQGRGFMPTFGFQSQMHYFPEHSGPTRPLDFDLPDQDPKRNKTFPVNVKIFDNKISSSVEGSYLRGTTVRYYPYVSNILPVETADREFTFMPFNMTVEIWSGESPDDPRRVKVQTIQLEFPQATALLPQTTAAGLQTRFQNANPNELDNITARDIIVSDVDVVRSLEFTGPFSATTGIAAGQRGDLRLGAALSEVPANYYSPRDIDDKANGYQGTNKKRTVHGLSSSHGNALPGHTGTSPFVAGGGWHGEKPPILPRGITSGVRRLDNGPGDWDRGVSKHMDGAMSNKVDEGNIQFDYSQGNLAYRVPYFRGRNIEDTGQSFFTPNRQLPSVAMIGSLPTGVKRKQPWQTLLLRPDPETSTTHPGAIIPPDHLMLDLFHMPIVEPYAISEPFSTAGKVNMNYVIAPFGYAPGDPGNLPNTDRPRSYLRRDSAVRGVLKSTFIMAVDSNAVKGGHLEDMNELNNQFYRFPIDLDRTIEQFEARFNDQQQGLSSRDMTLFRSASEICEVNLFPRNVTGTATGTSAGTVKDWNAFWNARGMTGDNMRERPYVHIYPRLTTKSNVYTIHMRCQAISKAAASKPNEFDPKRDKVLGEYRGSALVERFIDPNDETLSRYDASRETIDGYYRYRIISTKQFAPR